MTIKPRQKWTAVAIFFLFMLLHQTDRLLIGPLTSSIMAEFDLSEVQMGGIVTGSLVLGSIFYPIWGYLFDRFARPKLLAIASFIWGITTWFSAVAPSAGLFLVSRASTGIDDSSYPGIASLISDYFPPSKRSGIFGFLQISIPLGYLLGLLITLNLTDIIGWRMIYVFTGFLGILLSGLIFFGVKDLPRGFSEPELASVPVSENNQFSFDLIRNLIKIPSLRYMFIQGFIGVLPWQVITFWSFRYLEIERNFTQQMISSTMIPAVLFIGAGYFFGGIIGDFVYSRNKRGRLIVAIAGIILGSLFLVLALTTPAENDKLFKIALWATSFCIPLPSPNIATTVFDVVLPEIRSTATSIQYFLGNLGSAFTPLLAGFIAHRFSLEVAILSISVTAWAFTAIILSLGAYYMPADQTAMQKTLLLRAAKNT